MITHKLHYMRSVLLRMTSLVVLSMVAGLAHGQLPPSQTYSGIEYVTGGFGQDESTAFKQAQSDYGLALTFAVTEPGSASSPYAGDIHVQLRNAQGETVLDVTSTGPYFLANPKPGTYTLAVTFEGDTQTKDVTITADGSTEMKFSWKRPTSGPD